MNMIEIIQNLWRQEKIPIIEGLFKKDGSFYMLVSNKLIKSILPTKDYSKWNSDAYINAQIEDKDTTYYCGEGSWGSDGFIIAIKNNNFDWIFFGDLNPLEKLWIENEEIHILNNCQTQWTIPIEEPEKAFIKVRV